MVRRMTNWGVTKTNNDRNLLRYSHTFCNGWFTYHGFCHNNNIFQNKWVWILVVTVPYILDSVWCRKRQSKTEMEYSTIHYASVFNWFASIFHPAIPEIYLKSTKRKRSPDFPPIFRPCIALRHIVVHFKIKALMVQMWSCFFRIGNTLE